MYPDKGTPNQTSKVFPHDRASLIRPPPTPKGWLIPHQLAFPVSIGSWKGKAILDTGSPYILLNENLRRGMKSGGK